MRFPSQGRRFSTTPRSKITLWSCRKYGPTQQVCSGDSGSAVLLPVAGGLFQILGVHEGGNCTTQGVISTTNVKGVGGRWVRSKRIELTCPGDFNDDKSVDGSDFMLWQRTLGSTTDHSADGDSDADVDAADLAVWKANVRASLSVGLLR